MDQGEQSGAALSGGLDAERRRRRISRLKEIALTVLTTISPLSFPLRLVDGTTVAMIGDAANYVGKRVGNASCCSALVLKELFSYKFTDLLDFSSPSMEMLLAPAEILEFASPLRSGCSPPSLTWSIREFALQFTIAEAPLYQWSLSAPCINAALSRC
jgi:hypothetical protein